MARKEGSILIVDDNNDLLIALRLILSRTFTTIDTLKNPNLILSTLEGQAYDIILLDMNFKAGQNSGNEGIFWMNKILETDPEATVVFITAYGDGAGHKIDEGGSGRFYYEIVGRTENPLYPSERL